MHGLQKPLPNCMVKELYEMLVVSTHVEQPTRLAMYSQLRPGEHFKKLLNGSQPSWETNKSVR
jgi:hypothetical protein